MTPDRPAYLDAKPPKATVTQLPGTVPAQVAVQPPGTRKYTALKGLDLERIELQYRGGLQTVREIGRDHGVTHGRIVQLAKQFGWTQDVAARARHRAAEILAQPEPEPRAPNPHIEPAVNSATDAIVRVRLAHRRSIDKQRELVDTLTAEVQALTSNKSLRRLIQEAENEEDAGKLKALSLAIDRAQGLANRATVLKTLVEAQKALIALERQAYDLDGAPDDSNSRPPPDRSMTPAEMYRWMARNRGKVA